MKIYASLLTGLLSPLLSHPLLAQDSLSAKSDIVKLDFHILAEKKAGVRAGDPGTLFAYQTLLNQTNKLLAYGPVSVTDKTVFPPSGDKHDYMSIAPYFWPDSTKPNGLPYINRDGVVNPEVRDSPDKVICLSCVRTYICYPSPIISQEKKSMPNMPASYCGPTPYTTPCLYSTHSLSLPSCLRKPTSTYGPGRRLRDSH